MKKGDLFFARFLINASFDEMWFYDNTPFDEDINFWLEKDVPIVFLDKKLIGDEYICDVLTAHGRCWITSYSLENYTYNG